jgi:ABC-type multidrug transport system ATPase subunit
VISVQNITKTFNKGSLTAVADVSFEVGQGELFGIIGPDGAGKTTLFRVLTTLLLPDSGTARVANLDIIADFKAIRNSVGYMPGKFSLYQDLTIAENLTFFATIFGTTIEKNYDLIKDIYVQIEPFKKRRAGALSGGMKQKLALCCALIHRPKVLFLDEPTTGVDAVSRKEFWEMLAQIKAQGITILVSTPYMDEASRCDRVALMDNGRILDIDTVQGIIGKFDKPLFAVSGENMFGLLLEMRKWSETDTCFAFGDNHHLTLKDDTLSQHEILTRLQNKDFQHIAIKPITATIEDCFMKNL